MQRIFQAVAWLFAGTKSVIPFSNMVTIPQQLNPAEFEELHQALIAEVALTRALEEDIVADLARLV